VTVWAIVVAAGRGSRFGGAKVWAELAGRPVVEWSVAACRSVADGIVLVVPVGESATCPGVDKIVAGGATRSASVRGGLAAVPADATVVVVHDAARPAASAELFRAVVEAVAQGADGAVPGLAVVDTVKRIGPDGAVVETFERDSLVVVQTPQAFAAAALRRAHAQGGEASDDATLVERAGGKVVVVPGDARNRKLTTPDDLAPLADSIRQTAGGDR
jgi:2-C-methyl-D-erythritol 4-phosphate cytidylyltransferase